MKKDLKWQRNWQKRQDIQSGNMWLQLIMNGRFHTRGRTKCLDGQIVSDEQIV